MLNVFDNQICLATDPYPPRPESVFWRNIKPFTFLDNP